MSESKTMCPVAPPAKSAETVPKSGATAVATAPKHPTYATMIIKAVTALAERKGSSRQAIVKYILGTYNMSEAARVGKLVSGALKAQMEAGSVINATGTGLSGRFKLSSALKTQLIKVEKERAKKAEKKEEYGKRNKSASSAAVKPKRSVKKPTEKSASSAAVKPKKYVKKPTEKSSKPYPALKSPKKKSEGKPKGASKSKMMKPQAKSGKKSSEKADKLKAPKSKKAAAPKVEKAQTVAE